jgi:hypothetical protein
MGIYKSPNIQVFKLSNNTCADFQMHCAVWALTQDSKLPHSLGLPLPPNDPTQVSTFNIAPRLRKIIQPSSK